MYLLDDLLSAVDVRVGRHISEDCICGELAGKTRLLVTHQVQVGICTVCYRELCGQRVLHCGMTAVQEGFGVMMLHVLAG
jgi:hypothetical protein